jgi:hypothetical protein
MLAAIDESLASDQRVEVLSIEQTSTGDLNAVAFSVTYLDKESQTIETLNINPAQ